MAASPSCASWKRVPTCRTGLYTSGMMMSTVRPAANVIDASSRRKPMPTATSATDRVAKNSSTKPDRNAMRSTPIVEVRCARDSRATSGSGVRSRPKARSVGRPATRSSSWSDRVATSRRRLSVRPAVSVPTSHMNNGMSGSVITPMSADMGSSHATTASTAGVAMTVAASAGRNPVR